MSGIESAELARDGRHNKGYVALAVSRDRDTQCAGKGMVGRRAALYREDSAGSNYLPNHRLHHATVGAKESGVFAKLGNTTRNVFHDELLRTGNATFTGGVGSVSKYEAHTEAIGCLLHELAPLEQHGVSHMASEGVVDEGLSAHALGLLDDAVAAGDVIGLQDYVGAAGHEVHVLARGAGDNQHVRTHTADFFDACGRANDSLDDNNSAYVAVSGKCSHVRDGGFLFYRETSRVCSENNPVASVLAHHVFCGAKFFFVLYGGTGHNTDLKPAGGSRSAHYNDVVAGNPLHGGT